MPIDDDIRAQLTDAMKARDKVRTGALRSIRAALIETLKADGADTLGDDEARTVLRRLAKQRRESIEAFEQGGRDDLAAVERAELAVIETFLPSLADEATTRAWVVEAIAQTGATSPRDMGRVMGALMAAHKGEIDGKLANGLVRALLAG